MKKLKQIFKNPLYLLLGILVVIMSYVFLVDSAYNVGHKIGKNIELVKK
jgi:hypothetical protein